MNDSRTEPRGLAALLALLAVLLTSPALGQEFACTEIVGFSQTLQWFDTAAFRTEVGDDAWQLRGQAGGDLDVWRQPSLWDVPLESPCRVFSAAPDRVILTITLGHYEANVGIWVTKLRQTIATIRLVHPQTRRIVLQPLVGGPGNGQCPHPNDPFRGVRAAYNHPRIDTAIAQVAGDAPDLVAGPSPEVVFCGQYRDVTGHLTEPARAVIGQRIGMAYTTATPPSTTPPSTATPPGLPLGAPCEANANCRSGRCAWWRSFPQTPVCIAP